MPPDIIQTQKEVARKMLLGENTVPDDAWHTSIYDKKAADLDIVVATIIANIGRELEVRCEGAQIQPTEDGLSHDDSVHNQAIDRTLTLIRSITGISPTR